jgi:hypothetical protein
MSLRAASTPNSLPRGERRCVAPPGFLRERGFALLVGRWRVLQHSTASPSRIGDTAKATLVLTQFEHA